MSNQIILCAVGGVTFGISGSENAGRITVDLSRYDKHAVQALAAWLCCPLDELPRVMRMTTECMTVAEISRWDWAEFLYAPDGHGDCVNGLCKLRPHTAAETLFAAVSGILYSQEIRVLGGTRLDRIVMLCKMWMDMCKACKVFGVCV